MERLCTCDLREKEVINVCDGSKLGCPCDFEFDVCDGKITALVVPVSSGFLGLGKCEDIIIPWWRIQCIGEDTILVKLPAEECVCRENEGKKKKTGFKL